MKHNDHLRIASTVAKLLDSQFRFLNIRFGLDSILGLIPGLGDVVTLLFSFYLVWIGITMKLPSHEIARMIRNVAIDFIIGAIPLVGDFGDIFYKANLRNLSILEKYGRLRSNRIIEGEVVS